MEAIGHAKRIRGGIEKGIQQGRQEGRQEGVVSLLLRLMERCFGSVDAALRHRLQTADAVTLLKWGDRLVNANSAEEALRD
jgi:flagellar biosynthesis/type III secretory pathway protein FliH